MVFRCRRFWRPLCGVVDAVPARQGLGRWWARRSGASSDPDSLLPIIFLPHCSGRFRGGAG
jgi:hypothetical protein